MGASSSGASLEVSQMAVGPSAPPMMPMEAACSGEKLMMPPVMPAMLPASMNAAKMPNWAAAPSSRLFGLASSGPKSVMAPTPRKMSDGYRPTFTPM